jgi:hypothetical protein
MKYTIDELIMKLANTITGENLFNPYNQIDSICDQSTAPGLRQNNLRIYLNRYQKTKVTEMWVTKHIDSKTTKLSGIPLIAPAHYSQIQSMLDLSGMLEIPIKNSAQQGANLKMHDVWNKIDGYDIKPLVWSVLPFYSHKSDISKTELIKYAEIMEMMIDIFKPAKIITLDSGATAALSVLRHK